MNKPLDPLPERISRIVDDRKIHPWAKSIGISKGTIESIMKLGGLPGAEALTAIKRSENVRIDWLLDGTGTPYSVTICATDAEATEQFKNLLDDEPWDVTVVSDGSRLALVLDQPGSYTVKDGKDEAGQQQYRDIEYRIIEVLVGAIGFATMVIVKVVAKRKKVGFVLTEPVMMNMIHSGQFGTYRLWEASDAVLRQGEVIDDRHDIFAKSSHRLVTLDTPDEVELMSYYRSMTPENKLAVNQVASAMADYTAAANSAKKK